MKVLTYFITEENKDGEQAIPVQHYIKNPSDDQLQKAIDKEFTSNESVEEGFVIIRDEW